MVVGNCRFRNAVAQVDVEDEEGAAFLQDGSYAKNDGSSCFSTRRHVLYGLMALVTLTAIVEPARMWMLQAQNVAMNSRAVPATVEELRRAAASVSVDMLLQTTNDQNLDIGPLCDVIDQTIDAVGVRGLLRQVFETQAFRKAQVRVAKERSVLPGLGTRYEEHHMNVFYAGLINEPPTGGNGVHCTGCLWFLRHYVGAAIADRFLRDGSLSLNGALGKDEHVYKAVDFIQELKNLQLRPDADFVTVSTMHAFVWHMVAALRPGLPDGYPVDLLHDWCGDYVNENIWSPILDTDLGRECRHAFGHAIFYAVMRGETLPRNLTNEHYSARVQFRSHQFDTPKPLKKRMDKICRVAPLNGRARYDCFAGFLHSVLLMRKTNPPVLSLLACYQANGSTMCVPSKDTMTENVTTAPTANYGDRQGEAPLRVAMLGSGIWAEISHFPILKQQSAEFSTKAVWSRHVEGAEKLTMKFKKAIPDRDCIAYGGDDGLDALLGRDDVDAIIMSLPLDVQPTYVLRALEAGKHVLSEKPTAGTTKDGAQAIQTYRQKFAPKGLVWNVAEDFRYNKIYVETAYVVKETIGPLKTLDMVIEWNMAPKSPWLKTSWRADPSWGALGLFCDGGVHAVSALRRVAPSPPTAILDAKLTSNLDYMPGYDTLVARVEYEDGSSGYFNASYISKGRGRGIEITATDIQGKQVLSTDALITDGMGNKRTVFDAMSGKGDVFSSFARECKRATSTGNKEMELDDNITPEQSLLDVAFLEACLKSSLTGGERQTISRSF